MRVDLPEEDRMVVQSVRDFAAHHFPPDRADAQPERLSSEFFSEVSALGLWGMCVGTDRGGLGFSHTTGVAVISTLSAYSASVGLLVGQHALVCAGLVELAAKDRQSHDTLSFSTDAIASGSPRYAFIDAVQQKCVVETETSGGLVITGTASFVPGAGRAGGFLVTFAGGMAIVPASDIGLTVQSQATLGLNAADWADVVFDRVVVPEHGVYLNPDAHNLSRVLHMLVDAAVAVGIGQAALQTATTYAAERRQFGKSIAEFQAIQWKIADSAVELDAARSLLYRAADVNGTLANAAMAARYARSAASRMTRHGVQIHGGYGYTKEYVIERLFRDAHHLEGLVGAHETELKPILSAIYGGMR